MERTGIKQLTNQERQYWAGFFSTGANFRVQPENRTERGAIVTYYKTYFEVSDHRQQVLSRLKNEFGGVIRLGEENSLWILRDADPSIELLEQIESDLPYRTALVRGYLDILRAKQRRKDYFKEHGRWESPEIRPEEDQRLYEVFMAEKRKEYGGKRAIAPEPDESEKVTSALPNKITLAGMLEGSGSVNIVIERKGEREDKFGSGVYLSAYREEPIRAIKQHYQSIPEDQGEDTVKTNQGRLSLTGRVGGRLLRDVSLYLQFLRPQADLYSDFLETRDLIASHGLLGRPKNKGLLQVLTSNSRKESLVEMIRRGYVHKMDELNRALLAA